MHGQDARMIRAATLCAALLMTAGACVASNAAGVRHGVEWFDGADATPLARDGVEQLLSRPWPDAIDVQGESADGERTPMALESCRDYLEIADLRPRPLAGGTTLMIFQARALDCQAMTLALAAQPAAISHLRTLAFDEGLPDRLPWQVAMITSGSEAEQIAAERPHATWRQALFGPLTEFSPCGTQCARYGDPAQEQAVSLVARGDFDGDGIEDMLLASSDTAKGGSYHAVRMFLLTRRQPRGKVELIRELAY